MLYISKKVGSCDKLVPSNIDIQNCNLDHLFSSFKKGFIAFECLHITTDFRYLCKVLLLIYIVKEVDLIDVL